MQVPFIRDFLIPLLLPFNVTEYNADSLDRRISRNDIVCCNRYHFDESPVLGDSLEYT